MKHIVKLLIKRVLPQNVINRLKFILFSLPRTLEIIQTQRIFAAATDTPKYLDISMLEILHMKYPPSPEYGYDTHSLERRGIERSIEIIRLPGGKSANSFLELGCWDGMVSCCLSRKGKKATAIDRRDAGFDPRASNEGVNIMKMDASNLQFEDESFDFVFSYDAFEHFPSPEDVLREAIRVVKKGGYIYLDFGPLYYSPFGEHVLLSITVPYCHFLFPKNLIKEFAIQRKLLPIDFTHVNGWSLENYRELWSKYSHVLKKITYYEQYDLSHLSLIREYPSCFKNKSNYFDNFIVGYINVLFQKI